MLPHQRLDWFGHQGHQSQLPDDLAARLGGKWQVLEARADRLIRRLEAALKPPSRVGIDGSGATPRDGGRGVKTHLRPSPHQALGLGGRYRPGRHAWCVPADRVAPGVTATTAKESRGMPL